MIEAESKNIIKDLLSDLDKPRRKTNGRDKSKHYHKITISVSEEMKKDLMEFADTNKVSVSKLIKDLLIDNKIISS